MSYDLQKKCGGCGAPIFGKTCTRCAAPVVAKNIMPAKKSPIDPRHGLCAYSVHGEYCDLPGSMTFEVAGKTEKWFCPFHLRCTNPAEGKEIIAWGKKYLWHILRARKYPLLFDAPRVFHDFEKNPQIADKFKVKVYEDSAFWKIGAEYGNNFPCE